MTDSMKVGDVVVLRSGGPAMTVTAVDRLVAGGALHAWVSWFDGPTEKHATFPVLALDLAKKGDG